MKKSYFKTLYMACLLVILTGMILPNSVWAQEKPKSEKDDEKEEKKKSIEELTEDHQKIEGLFTFYQNDENGELQLIIDEDQLDKNFIHFAQVANGNLDSRIFRGQFAGSKIFTISKYFNKIEFTLINTNFYFDPDNAISKSESANISNSIVASIKIEAHDEKTGKYLIKADDLFLKETFVQIKPPKSPDAKPGTFSLGKLDDSKTKIQRIKNYPENTVLEVEYVYSSPSVKQSSLSNGVSDGRNVSIQMFHSLIQLPENDYKVRLDDPRVGYFLTQVDDKTSMSSTPYRDLIHRWNLKKKDPSAAVSEPVEPIVWWMENSTPEEIRPIIKKAGEQWNIAFEAAGFKNAVVIKQQPDDAIWDAGDIRYNVLRWTSSPNPPWGGYGPSFVNPLTGQILGADIMLEFASLGSMLRNESLFETAGLESFLGEISDEVQASGFNVECTASLSAQLNQFFGSIAHASFEEDGLEKSKMINEFLHFLILHEMGHTLGLNHNMKSSQLHSIKDVHNSEITSKVGLTGSVMDYPAINYNENRNDQGQYWTTRPGPYDIWAIQFGYQDMNDSERNSLLSKSTEPELIFGNDADDMRSPGKAIDPRVNVSDMTNEPVQFSIDRIKLSNTVGENLLSKYQKSKEGASYQLLLNSYYIITREQAISGQTISRFIGGVYVDRSAVGQNGATKPFTPVSYKDQKKAMNALKDYMFAPDAFNIPNELYNYIAQQRRGFNFYGKNEDPKIHARVINMQSGILKHLLHKNTLQRILDSELYGNEYSLSEMMTALNDAIFKEDIEGDINTFRQNLQMAYTKMLIDMVAGKSKDQYSSVAQSMALYNLKNILSMAKPSGNTSSMAHKQHLNILISNTLKEVK